jgi:hypothetical protein
MASFNVLLDAPAIPRVLHLLLNEGAGRMEDALVESLPDREYARRAVEALVCHGIIKREGGMLTIADGEETRRRVRGIMRFYDDIDRLARRKLLFRGILNATQYACLVHFATFSAIMESEGFTASDVGAMLEKDGSEGYVERLKIMYRSREGVRHRFFPFIPLYYYPHFLMMKPDNTEHLRGRLKSAGIFMVEEEYLLGHYPKDIASQSRDYIVKEKEHIRDKIKNEAFDIWWYYRF